MLRIGQVEATATQDGKYTDGSVAGGIAATRLRAAAFNAMQEELAHIVESAGLALDINDMTQVLKAIQKLTLSRANPFADIKSDGAAAISTALANLGLQTIRPDPRSTKIYSPDLKKFLMVSDTIWGMWNGESNTPVALTIEQGGTGETTVDGVKAAFGIDKLQPKGEYADKSAETPQIFSDAIKAKYGLEIKDASEIGSVSLYAANNEASIHGWSGRKITIPDKAGTMALAGESVSALRLSAPREVTVTAADAWVNFTTSEMVVGIYITPTPGGGAWVLNKVKVATLQAYINGAWVNVTQ